MFWKRTNLYKRVEKLFRNFACISKFRHLNTERLCVEGDGSDCYAYIFNSELGEVHGYITDNRILDEGYTFYYGCSNSKSYFHLEVDKNTTKVEPAITKSSIMKAEEISLAIYELEKYIEDSNLDRDTLEDFHNSEVEKLENY